jgi:hypothetical protein
MTQSEATKINELKDSLRGEILLPGDGAYETARKIWNATIDKRPALIARCATTSDVVYAVRQCGRPRTPLRTLTATPSSL